MGIAVESTPPLNWYQRFTVDESKMALDGGDGGDTFGEGHGASFVKYHMEVMHAFWPEKAEELAQQYRNFKVKGAPPLGVAPAAFESSEAGREVEREARVLDRTVTLR
jgi:hypothetical protein